MASPADEIDRPSYPLPQMEHPSQARSSDEEGTMVGGDSNGTRDYSTHVDGAPSTNHLHVNTAHSEAFSTGDLQSPSRNREQAHRLDDDLRLLQIERQVSQAAEDQNSRGSVRDPSTIRRERTRREEVVDEFDVATNPVHERGQGYKPPQHPENNVAKFLKRIHHSSFLVRYMMYILPIALIILVPLLVGALAKPIRSKDPGVGGVKLVWFCVWLEIVWFTLWIGRVIAKALPFPVGLISSLFVNNSKTWRDMAKQLEIPATLFFWALAVFISFLPTTSNHPVGGGYATRHWQHIMQKVLIGFLILASFNFAEKILIQLIAISFHLRTYSDRIDLSKFNIASLTKLYAYSKTKISMADSEFEAPFDGPGSGARTPGQYIDKAQKGTVEAFNKIGDVAGKIAGDFRGKADVKQSDHPHQVVLKLLSSNGGSQVLARRLYRTFGRDDTQTVVKEDLKNAFDNEEEADAAFGLFDKDMNGDISMEELEAVCVEIGTERKAITASLKDLDSVVAKLDNVLMLVLAAIAILVLISYYNGSVGTVLTSTGSIMLALSWLLQATAQEFLQSIIFVFVKHPFDVGDRVTIYGNTGSLLKGDDYNVKEISLLFTEFKKMEGHIVQASNSALNTLFILNQRRSAGLAEAVPLILKYGTTVEQIESLRAKLLEFVKAEKREYQGNVLTELRAITEVHSISLNVVFFYKSNWQNELLRLQRRNKFITALMVCMQEIGIEGPRMRFPGMREGFPVYMQSLPYDVQKRGLGGTPDFPDGPQPPTDTDNASIMSHHSDEANNNVSRMRSSSISRSRPRGESLAQMGRRMDFSLGASNASNADLFSNVLEDKDKEARDRLPKSITSPSRLHSRSNRDRSDTVVRSTSRASTFGPGALRHRVTEPSNAGRSSGSAHRKGFFGRKSSDTNRLESGLADIAEDSAHDVHSPFLNARNDFNNPTSMRTNTNETTRFPSYGGYGGDGTDAHDVELQRLRTRDAPAPGVSPSRRGGGGGAAAPPVSVLNADPYPTVQPTADVPTLPTA